MSDASGTGQLNDLERELREAEQAQAEAEAAAQRAALARAEAEAAQQRAREEQEARRRAWAEGIVASYDADLAAAETAVQEAANRFATAAVQDLPAAVAAYIAWAEAAIRHYTLQVRVATVAPVVGLEATPAERLLPPPFSAALDDALKRHVATLSARARDEAAAEIHSMLDVDSSAAAPPLDPL